MEASIHRLNRLEYLADDFIKITMLLSPEEANRVSEDFNRDFDGNLVAVPSGFGAIDFIQKGMHKAWGLKQLLNHWDLSEKNVMAFGDGDNDISSFVCLAILMRWKMPNLLFCKWQTKQYRTIRIKGS